MGGLPVADGEALPDDVPLVISCFDTIDEAEAFIEAGAPGDLEQLIGDGVQARGASATIALGRIWTGTSRSGTVLIQWGPVPDATESPTDSPLCRRDGTTSSVRPRATPIVG